MTRVYIANAIPDEVSALRLMLNDLKMEVIGEAADWAITLAQVPERNIDILLIDWNLLPNSPTSALDFLRCTSPKALFIVLISHLDARQQAAVSSGADAFISKGELPERIAKRLHDVEATLHQL